MGCNQSQNSVEPLRVTQSPFISAVVMPSILVIPNRPPLSDFQRGTRPVIGIAKNTISLNIHKEQNLPRTPQKETRKLKDVSQSAEPKFNPKQFVEKNQNPLEIEEKSSFIKLHKGSSYLMESPLEGPKQKRNSKFIKRPMTTILHPPEMLRDTSGKVFTSLKDYNRFIERKFSGYLQQPSEQRNLKRASSKATIQLPDGQSNSSQPRRRFASGANFLEMAVSKKDSDVMYSPLGKIKECPKEYTKEEGRLFKSDTPELPVPSIGKRGKASNNNSVVFTENQILYNQKGIEEVFFESEDSQLSPFEIDRRVKHTHSNKPSISAFQSTDLLTKKVSTKPSIPLL